MGHEVNDEVGCLRESCNAFGTAEDTRTSRWHSSVRRDLQGLATATGSRGEIGLTSATSFWAQLYEWNSPCLEAEDG